MNRGGQLLGLAVIGMVTGVMAMANDPGLKEVASDIKISAPKSDRCQNMLYKVQLVTANDGGLIGIYCEIENASRKVPLVLQGPAEYIPVILLLTDADGANLIRRETVKRPSNRPVTDAKKLQSDTSMIEWRLPPGGRNAFFIPIRELLKSTSNTQPYRGCELLVLISATPRALPTFSYDHPLEPLLFNGVVITTEALRMNVSEAAIQAQSEAALREKR